MRGSVWGVVVLWITMNACRTSADPAEPVFCADDPPGTVSVARLYEEIVDLDRLARVDETPYVRRLASSTNRASDLAFAHTWYGDDFGNPRFEGDERVVMESSHPGVITRLWSANPNGRIRVYLDGNDVAAIDEDLPELLSGRVEGFEPPYVYESAGGSNLIAPISWSHSVRVTITTEEMYFTIDYREYGDDAIVEPFPGARTPQRDCAVRSVARVLRDGLRDPDPNVRAALDTDDPGAALTVDADAGGSVVRLLRLRLDEDRRDVLERTALVVDVDGERTIEVPLASVLAPMRDAADVDGLALRSSGSVWTLRLPMPFASTFRVFLSDRGGGRVRASVEATVETSSVDDDTYRLHAVYVGPREFDVSTSALQARLVEAVGGGRFVGLVYEVGNRDPDPLWWGEGDPVFAVDGEAPFRGTGTEDHFLYAYCSTERFSSDFSGQTRANARDYGGFVSLHRFHTSDDVPFRSSFAFDFELLAWGAMEGHSIVMPMTSVAFVYAEPGAAMIGGTGADGAYTSMWLPDGYVRPGRGWIDCR